MLSVNLLEINLGNIVRGTFHEIRETMNFHDTLRELLKRPLEMKHTKGEHLDLEYCIIFPKAVADNVFHQLQSSVEYYEDDITQVKVFGKWHKIPRQQVAYGDQGIQYSFSGTKIPAKPWMPLLATMRDFLCEVIGVRYNFVLVNRYRDGNDHIGEHKDNEKELDRFSPIASISLGQERTFVLKHEDSREKGPAKMNISPVRIDLAHGSLLLMKPPTNDYWYHSIPARKTAPGVRINLTFRKINTAS